MNDKISNLIFSICMIIITLGIIILIIDLIIPSPIYYSTFEKDGKNYIFSSAYIIETEE